jgi:hypothetical protein
MCVCSFSLCAREQKEESCTHGNGLRGTYGARVPIGPFNDFAFRCASTWLDGTYLPRFNGYKMSGI